MASVKRLHLVGGCEEEAEALQHLSFEEVKSEIPYVGWRGNMGQQ